MKKSVLSVLFLFSVITILAQQEPNKGSFKIKGSLIDSTSGQPLQYATSPFFRKEQKRRNVMTGNVKKDNSRRFLENLTGNSFLPSKAT